MEPLRKWRTVIEPYRVKSIEPLGWTSSDERERALAKAEYNVFNIPAEQVLIDLLTDSGTSAMSARQWAALMRGDESYAGARSYYVLEKVVRDWTGFREVIPAHQGRAAERILFSVVGGPDKVFLANAHFDTTRANIEATGAKAVDLPVPEAADWRNRSPFKGDMDTRALESAIRAHGPKNIPLVLMTVTNNTVQGQPVSLRNLRETREICGHYKIPLFLDAARFAENAYLIRQREHGCQFRPASDIAREMFSYAQGCLMSAKKDLLCHIGGVLALNDKEWADKARQAMMLWEGFPTYGGLAGRDLEIMAQGLGEATDEEYLEHRVHSSAYLAEGLRQAGIPIAEPGAAHAVYVAAEAWLPHVPAERCPTQALAGELYRTGGIRAAAMGAFLRLALPRRVYSRSHMDFIVEVFADIASRKEGIKGLRLLGKPETLGQFSARMAPVL